MKYPYMNDGGQMSWKNGPPRQSQGADARSLGSLGGTTLDHPTLVLPAPGAPEPLNGVGCKCSGSCGCSNDGSPLGAITDTLAANPLLTAAAAFAAWWVFFKKKH